MSEVKDTQEQPKVEIEVKNFGPIAEANIDLRPLTVFVGPSNTGKTYFATLVYGLYGVFPNMIEPHLLFPAGLQSTIGLLHALRKFILNNPNSPAKEKVQDILDQLKITDRPFRLSDLPSDIRKLVLT
ncbi:AAA family ATPase, partial [Candidatus Poribacteria bacterium]|nr:AAA family ATPase [Candidatus Poribacteria bacterium]